MIKKFQQGDQIQQLAVEVVQGIAQELQADPQQVAQAAQQNPEALEAAMQVYTQTKDIKQTAQTFLQTIQQKTQQKKKETQAAKHGAKLNYIKSLKHQCAEDEEVYYYKKGGSVGCGCRKKEDGGEIQKDKEGAVAKFKQIRKASTGTAAQPIPKRDKSKDKVKVKIHPEDTTHIYNPKTKKMEVRDLSGNHPQFKSLTKEEYQKQTQKKRDDIDLKGYNKCGAKLKKHFNGGSLNRIPFIKVELQKKV